MTRTTEPTASTPTLQIHEYAELFPLLEGPPFEELVQNIKRHGLRDPIVLTSDGKILDGRNRYRACLASGVEPTFRTWRGPGKAFQYVISVNLHRRHLDTSQRAMIAARIATLEQGARTDLAENSAMSQPEAAALLNVSRGSVQNAKKVLDTGTPELVEAVRDGEISVGAATEVATLPREEQQDVVKEVKKGAKASTVVAKKKKKQLSSTPPKREDPVPAPKPKLDISAFKQALRPIMEGLKTEGRKNMATMSPGTVAHLTFRLEQLVDRLDEDAQRGRVRTR